MINKPPPFSIRLIEFLQKIEDLLLISLLLFMIFIAVLQIFLRNFMGSGISWADPLVRVLVLWIGLIGAMVASRGNKHISIDIISRYLPWRIRKETQRITSLFTTIVCGIMAWVSIRFVLMEKADGLILFAGVPAWICEIIIPFAFAVISFRYLLFTLNGFTHPNVNKKKK
ncbi:MAG: TRAP transporter small permease [Desulfobacteraceae bacterium]|nr:TRAP transporter small permease [Desulfobacteraceae bacterium]